MMRMRGILPKRLMVVRLGLLHLSCLAIQTQDTCLIWRHGSNQNMHGMSTQTISVRLQPLIPPHTLLIQARTKGAFIRTICRPTTIIRWAYQMIGHYLTTSIFETFAPLLLIAAAQVLRKSRRQVIHLPQPPQPLLKSRELERSANVRMQPSWKSSTRLTIEPPFHQQRSATLSRRLWVCLQEESRYGQWLRLTFFFFLNILWKKVPKQKTVDETN